MQNLITLAEKKVLIKHKIKIKPISPTSLFVVIREEENKIL
jgi:hypothetical protein